jgi:hypothetical protein
VRRMLVASGAVMLALAFSVSSGAATAWDQAKVTDLAKQVAQATVELRAIVEKNPDKPPGAARKAQYSAREDLRLLVSATKRLAKRLAAGAGRDETEGLYQRAANLRSDAEAEARRADMLANTKTQAEKTLALLDQLGAYYRD